MRIFDHTKISKRRKELGISQRKLAIFAGISREHFNEIEKGRSIPRANTIARIAEVLKVKEDYFFIDEQTIN